MEKYKLTKQELRNLLQNSSDKDKNTIKTLLNIINGLKSENNKLKNQLYLDPLTKIYNRHYYNDVIRPQSLNSEYFVMMADVNNLKITNDTKGHKDGDELILKVTNILKNFGIVIRMGGDEFLVISNLNILNLNTKFKEFSYGVVKKPKNVSIEDAVIKADELLYKDKLSKNSYENVHDL